ncbi:MAG: isoprenylcysteine carboxylmethyltransferase family protein [Methanomicrobiales archaeon]|jgi:protein-S-isoprenylcysteine O-methyltransferase
MAQFFLSASAELFYDLVASLWILSEVVGGGIIPHLRRRGTKIERRDKGSQFLIIGCILLSIAISFTFAASGIALLPGFISYTGSALMLAGIAVRQWSIAVLGSFFSPTVGIQKGQKVVNRGPYRLVRHPSYTGALLIIVGVGLALRSWGAVLVILFITGLAYSYRIQMEEKVLISELGDEYVQYTKVTKKLIPYIL